MVNYRYLGNSGFKISEITYGNWVTHASQVGDDAAIATFARESAALVERLGPVMALVLTGARAGDEDFLPSHACSVTNSTRVKKGRRGKIEA